jgi:hypothetical protein
MPEHPNLFIDSSWWNPADFMLLFGLVPPGQILWASDCPYGQPLFAAATQLRCALAAGLGRDALQAIAGGQLERLLAGEEPADLGPPPGPGGAQDPAMERVVSHLVSAVGRVMAEGEMTESIALARLALDRDGPYPEACEEIAHLLDLADEHNGEPPPGRRFPRAAQFVIFALTVARTPQVALPAGRHG